MAGCRMVDRRVGRGYEFVKLVGKIVGRIVGGMVVRMVGWMVGRIGSLLG
jgi:hypothetical protein